MHKQTYNCIFENCPCLKWTEKEYEEDNKEINPILCGIIMLMIILLVALMVMVTLKQPVVDDFMSCINCTLI
jgi:hypothetical protein